MVPNSMVSVPYSQCQSRKSFTEKRTRFGYGCTESIQTRTRNICLPTQDSQLINALRLGSTVCNNHCEGKHLGKRSLSHNDIIRLSTFPPHGGLDPIPLTFPPPKKCPEYGTNGQVCHGYQKRSVGKPKRAPKSIPKEEVTLIPNGINGVNPIPFNWLEHGPHFRSKRYATCCGSYSERFVLFVLDTSGSIGSENFNTMKNAISLLTSLFCGQVKFAVITFSTRIHLEFCFNCYYSTQRVRSAIENILFRGGATRTGATAKCICEELLQPSCGISSYPSCLDVVFITDGKSNDPNLEICEEIKCLHRQFGINTHAIGINSGPGFTHSYNLDELNCISSSSNFMNTFEFESFNSFGTTIEDVARYLSP